LYAAGSLFALRWDSRTPFLCRTCPSTKPHAIFTGATQSPARCLSAGCLLGV
jgi:hypothetical protein